MFVFTSESVSPGSGPSANVDSARANLAGTFVNAFVNAGFGNDKLMVAAEEGNSWVYKNKDHGGFLTGSWRRCTDDFFIQGMMSAAASLGLGLLWDTDMGLSHIDKYTYSHEEWIKVLISSFLRHSPIPTELYRLVHFSLPAY